MLADGDRGNTKLFTELLFAVNDVEAVAGVAHRSSELFVPARPLGCLGIKLTPTITD